MDFSTIAVSDQLVRQLGLRGKSEFALDQRVSPVVEVGPTAPYPFGTRKPWTRSIQVVGGVAQNGFAAITNRAASQVDVVVERIKAQFRAAQLAAVVSDFQLFYANRELVGNTTAPEHLDSRFWGVDPAVVSTVKGDGPEGFFDNTQVAGALVASAGEVVTLVPNVMPREMQFTAGVPVILRPNSFVGVSCLTVTLTWTIHFAGFTVDRQGRV